MKKKRFGVADDLYSGLGEIMAGAKDSALVC